MAQDVAPIGESYDLSDIVDYTKIGQLACGIK